MKSENWPLDLTACNSSTRVSLLHGFVAKAWLGLRENERKRLEKKKKNTSLSKCALKRRS